MPFASLRLLCPLALALSLSACGGSEAAAGAAPQPAPEDPAGGGLGGSAPTDTTAPVQEGLGAGLEGRFVHPGTLNIQSELDFVSEKIAAGEEPWAGKFETIVSIAAETPSGVPSVDSTVDAEANSMKADAQGVYAAALAFHYSGNTQHADNAVAIFQSWADFSGFTAGSDQDKLLAAWIGALFGPAADLLLSYEGWSAADREATAAMFERAFFPQLETASTWNGNVDLTQIEALLAISVFLEDVEMFQLGLTRFEQRMPQYFYLASDGNIASANWHSPTAWVDGLTQETCRDNGHHAQFALGAALGAAEIAHHQGVDAYGEQQARLSSAMELLAAQLNTGTMLGVCADDFASQSRYNTFEIGYRHYATRLNVALPETLRLLSTTRLVGRSDWNIFYETLTHGVALSAP